jgi:hypothetical protein
MRDPADEKTLDLLLPRGRGRPRIERTEEERKAAANASAAKYRAKKRAKTMQMLTNVIDLSAERRKRRSS